MIGLTIAIGDKGHILLRFETAKKKLRYAREWQDLLNCTIGGWYVYMLRNDGEWRRILLIVFPREYHRWRHVEGYCNCLFIRQATSKYLTPCVAIDFLLEVCSQFLAMEVRYWRILKRFCNHSPVLQAETEIKYQSMNFTVRTILDGLNVRNRTITSLRTYNVQYIQR